MSSINGSGSHEHRLEELALLPAGDPLREGMERRLASAAVEERALVGQIIEETDRLQGLLLSVSIPADLEQKLLPIAQIPRPSGIRRIIQAPLGWKHLAACLVVALGVLAFFYWPRDPRPMLEAGLRRTMVEYAVKNHIESPKLAYVNSDIKGVEGMLAASGLGFPVMVPFPLGKVDLEGGGICLFGTTTAAYTRWKQDGQTVSLYQFDGKELGVPAIFRKTVDEPKDLWQGEKHYQVVIWPGSEGKCTWALVMEKDKAVDPFQMY